MVVICPTVTAYDVQEFRTQMERVAPFIERVHIDLMDGEFAPTKSPALNQIWWPHHMQADLHLMYQHPMDYLEQIIKLNPRMVIVHNEADMHHMHFAGELHKEKILVGLAILADTPVEHAYQIMHSFDQVLVFSGDLGHHGGTADMGLLDKVKKIKTHHPEAEIAWDGGINAENIEQLVRAGVTVLNVGGYIQKSDHPANAYATLKALVDEANVKKTDS
jgi:ribulose-phosphate 3-epimerase